MNNRTWTRRGLMAAAGSLAATGWAVNKAASAAGLALPPLSAYGSLPGIEHVALSPNGKRVAFIGDSNAGRALMDFDLDTDSSAGIGIGKDPVTYTMWADDETVFAVTSMLKPEGPNRDTVSYGGFLNIRTRRHHQLVATALYGLHTPNNYVRIRVGDSNRLTVPQYGKGDMASRVLGAGLYGYSTDSGRAFDLDVDGQDIVNWAIQRDGTIVARSEYNEDTDTWTIRYKGDKGWHAIYSLKEAVDTPDLYGLGRDGASLLIRFNAGELAGRYVEMAPDGSLSAPFELDGWDYYPLYNQATYRLAGFISTRTVDSYVLFDPAMKNLPALINKALPDSRNYIIDFAEEPRQVLVLSENDDDAGTYYYFNFLTGQFKEIGSPYPEAGPGPVSRISYKARDGLELEGFLTLPRSAGAAPLPVVVLPHGGFGNYDEEGFDWLAQAIASRGYAVVQPNYRGSGGRNRAFLEAGFGELGGKVLDDLEDAVAYLAKSGRVDAARAAIVGRGIGGYLALAGVSVRPGSYRCAVSIGGPGDLKAYMQRQREDYGFKDDASGLVYIKRFFGPAEGWPAISPIEQAARVACPVLQVCGEYDSGTRPQNSQAMHKALQKAGKTSELLMLKEETSQLTQMAARLQALEAVTAFLAKYNPAG